MPVKVCNAHLDRKLRSPAAPPQAIFFCPDPDRQSGDAAVRHGVDGASAQAARGTKLIAQKIS
jgi:hypothetical protein